MTVDAHAQRILILDFGSQYAQIIARRVRELGVYCEIHPFNISEKDIRDFAPQGIILSGGPESVVIDSTPRAPKVIFELGCPIFGICYGMQTMAAQLGGKVIHGKKREFGYARVEVLYSSPLLHEIEDHVSEDNHSFLDVWMSHGDEVDQIPPGFKLLAGTENTSIVAMADEEKRFYGVQFHPEVFHTRQGGRIFERFVTEICQCKRLWTTQNIIDEISVKIKAQVGTDQVILGLSGGADSAITAALLHKVIGKQLNCVFVDTGLLRLNEAQDLDLLFVKHLGMNVLRVDASDRFYAALKGVTDPEAKRKVIGKLFVEIFDEEAKKIKDAKWLAQGTIYSDVIESAGTHTGTGHVIKSHHNVGGLPEKMKLKLLEPLRELFKDETRKIGLELGLPYDLVYRHPFPGPGLAIRVLGEVKKEFVEKLRAADAVFMEELRKQELYDKVSQAFVVFLPVKSVGVLGDARHYDHVVCLRMVETDDFMTAHWAQVPYKFLEEVSNRIINEVRGISRVVYDISSKPPATIEWE